MSSSIYFYMEVKDKDGNWQMVKYLENGKYDCNTKRPEDLGDDFYKLKYPFEMRKTIWVGTTLRDWIRSRYSTHIFPKDISIEVVNTIEHKNANEYKTNFSWISLEDLNEMYDSAFNSWKIRLQQFIEKKKESYIVQKFDEAKKEILEAIPNKNEVFRIPEQSDNESHESDDESDDFEYLTSEWLEDLMEVREEIEALRTYAIAYTGNKFISEEDIRLYYYFE